jgi:hypothetical protein
VMLLEEGQEHLFAAWPAPGECVQRPVLSRLHTHVACSRHRTGTARTPATALQRSVYALAASWGPRGSGLHACWPRTVAILPLPCCAAGEHDNEKRKLVRQIAGLHRHYHGGLRAYIRNAKKLLAESKEGASWWCRWCGGKVFGW